MLKSSSGWQAFSCHRFDDSTAFYLVADVNVQCSAPYYGTVYREEHLMVTQLAWFTISLYAVGLFVFNAALLYRARKA